MEDSMKNVYELLRHKEQQLQILSRQVEALRIAAAIVAEEEKRMGHSGEGGDKGPSQPQMIRQVLIDKGAPMHVTEIVDAIKRKYQKEIKAGYVTAVIYRYKKRGKFFRKTDGKPNTFELLEWSLGQNTSIPAESSRAVK
jgi:hypothetical protein